LFVVRSSRFVAVASVEYIVVTVTIWGEQIAEMAISDPSLSKRMVRRYPIVMAEAVFAVEQVRLEF
jgi:hypothetical protein